MVAEGLVRHLTPKSGHRVFHDVTLFATARTFTCWRHQSSNASSMIVLREPLHRGQQVHRWFPLCCLWKNLLADFHWVILQKCVRAEKSLDGECSTLASGPSRITKTLNMKTLCESVAAFAHTQTLEFFVSRVQEAGKSGRTNIHLTSYSAMQLGVAVLGSSAV